MEKREFTVEGEYRYNRSSPTRWVVSHLLRYPVMPLFVILANVLQAGLYSYAPVLVGQAFDLMLSPQRSIDALLRIALLIAAVRLVQGLIGLAASGTFEVLAQRFARDAREELMISLLGKSQTFHNRQQTGDIMARATNDVGMLNAMVSPGLSLIFSSMLSFAAPLVGIAFLRPQLLLTPLIFAVFFAWALRRYTRQLNPVAGAARMQFGTMNAGLTESVSGIEVVKAYAQERAARAKFERDARAFRDLAVKEGQIRARYLPLLLYGIMYGVGFAHALYLYRVGALSVGDIVAFMGLLGVLKFPTFISIFTFSLVQMGLASAGRILELINAESELDENERGVAQEIQGQIVFSDVSYGYGATPILRNISFTAQPGDTIAIVGQTGAGKSTLTKLVNRTYDVTDGELLIDGIEVRDWSLHSLRSQISTIEQDIFLFSRSIADNIRFGAIGPVPREQVEQAAREAQAHDFIMALPEGYDTVIGERGVTLSGGQRQRIAIARAFITNPRILILDDSTSAIDSATEDQIQRAMRRILRGRTTLLITHRLSQIRWADRILVLRRGELVDQGTHEELLQRSEAYQHIFARYERQAHGSTTDADDEALAELNLQPISSQE
ncbi:MAG: ABC transporter ATP-binding protein/permease [Chloroflexota bacterium]|nr:ABC transporter ATP-binding protein/permease [Chloroflexota bacterium]